MAKKHKEGTQMFAVGYLDPGGSRMMFDGPNTLSEMMLSMPPDTTQQAYIFRLDPIQTVAMYKWDNEKRTWVPGGID
jgi:hypothetical protein